MGGEKKRKKRVIFCEIYKIPISVSINQVHWTTAMIICLGTVYGCWCVPTAQLKSERDLLESLKYLLSGPSQKTLPNPGGGGAFALLEIRRKVGLPSNSAVLSLERQRVWTELIPLSHHVE